MTEDKLTLLTEDEFVNKLLAGGRDFSNTRAETKNGGFDLSGHERIEELNNYLKSQPLRENPVILNNSEFAYVRAKGIYLPYTQAKNADFSVADLRESCFKLSDFKEAILNKTYFTDADLKGANFYRACLADADLEKACLKGANLSGASLCCAKVDGTDFQEADFSESDIRYIQKLGSSRHLCQAKFYNTKVREEDMHIIRSLITADYFELDRE